ncbi:hypothetical protein NW768_009317 [Fusarium equiseti]|uniref:Uncharacterized protein n=1 Tax=Fusarium equiseti TaxID=61235 RepID=A0ABQ8R392_FUSEQ|nr:hypothetical protein NW768_009317 [Fusarium equiseti]
MSDDSVSPSSTSSTQASTKTISTYQPLPPQTSITHIQNNDRSQSSSLDSIVTVVYSSSPQASSSRRDTQDSAMFSTLIGHTRGLFPLKESKVQAVTDIGDFDHTPPPSGRASVELLESKEKQDTTSEQLLQKPSFDTAIGNDNSSEPMLAPLLKKPNTISAETSGASLDLPFHKASSSQNETVMDSMRKSSRHDTQTQASPNQPPLVLSNISSGEE